MWVANSSGPTGCGAARASATTSAACRPRSGGASSTHTGPSTRTSTASRASSSHHTPRQTSTPTVASTLTQPGPAGHGRVTSRKVDAKSTANARAVKPVGRARAVLKYARRKEEICRRAPAVPADDAASARPATVLLCLSSAERRVLEESPHAAGDVGLGRWIASPLRDGDEVERAVELAVATALWRCRVWFCPEVAGTGEVPPRRANAASLWQRPGWDQAM